MKKKNVICTMISKSILDKLNTEKKCVCFVSCSGYSVAVRENAILVKKDETEK